MFVKISQTLEKKSFKNNIEFRGGGGSVGEEIYEISVFVSFILSEIVDEIVNINVEQQFNTKC